MAIYTAHKHARALWSYLNPDDIVNYDYACGDGGSQRMNINTLQQPSTKTEAIPFEVKVYPNPSQDGVMNISFKNSRGYNKLLITDIFGRKVWDEKVLPGIDIVPVKLNNSKGMFFLQVSNINTGKQVLEKIINQ
jgi:hypothetical protein